MIDKVEQAVRTYPINSVNSRNNCGRINKSLHLAISQDTSVESNFVRGEVSNGSKSEPHYFVLLKIQGIDYVIDGAIDQFVGEERMFTGADINSSKTVNDKIVFDKLNNTPFNYMILEIL